MHPETCSVMFRILSSVCSYTLLYTDSFTGCQNKRHKQRKKLWSDGPTKGSIQCYWLSGLSSPQWGEPSLHRLPLTRHWCMWGRVWGTELGCDKFKSLAKAHRVLKSTAGLRPPGCRSFGLSNLAKVPRRGGAGANSHTGGYLKIYLRANYFLELRTNWY